jgi:hypothetical protein
MICFAVVCFLAIGFLLIPLFFFRFYPQNLNDVISLVRSIDRRELEDLSSEIIEGNLRTSLPPDRFRVEQRKRALLLFEYLRRMSFNAWVLLAWAYREQRRIEMSGNSGDIVPNLTEEVLATGTAFRVYSLAALAKLSTQILLNRLRIAPVPRPAHVTRSGRTDALRMYRDLAAASMNLAALAGTEAKNRFASALFGSPS